MAFDKIKIFLFIILITLSNSSVEDDIVGEIPDYSYRGRLYSGYLSSSTVKQFHYMFNLASEDYENKPLVLWLNGGPGCSSLEGWASENGPMKLDSKGKFNMNEYSWNKAANMLYMESPGDVGFSYIDSKLDYELEINDDIAAQDNFNALQDFFKKFPSFKGKDFYISGESYAGIYIPMLAEKIINYNNNVSAIEKINLKGILVGNGVADWNYDIKNAQYDFVFTHHLISYEERQYFNKYCIKEIDKEKCNALIGEVTERLENINLYDYLQKCATPTNEYGDKDYFSSYYLKSPWAFHNLKQKQQKLKEKLDRIKSQNIRNDNIFKPPQSLKTNLSPPCMDTTQINKYFNREEVKRALHVKMDKTWDLCSSDVNKRYVIQDKGSIWAYPTILNSGVRVLIYSGDTDLSVPFNGNQAWITNLKLEIVKKWTQWRAFDDIYNVSGYYIKYKGLTFCTVKGTGHMVPEWKPKEAYYMFSKFLNNEDF